MTDETAAATEPPEVRLRRVRMRSWRRGTREMDLVLGGFADGALAGLDPDALDAYEALLSENDHDIYQWIAGRVDTPVNHLETVVRIRAFHRVD
jgi:antitoxin CptB